MLCMYMVIRNKYWFSAVIFTGKLNKLYIYKLIKFALMAITSAICVPVMLLIIRTNIEKNLGISEAGYWQATWKISEIYLMLVTGGLAAYYLPRVSEIRNKNELILELKKVYSFTIPIVLLSSLFIYEFRDLIIKILFTSEFMPMRDLFLWQFIGDIIKVISWVISYLMLGKGMAKSYIISEIGFSLLFIISSKLFLVKYGVLGITIAYTFTYLIYLVGMLFVLNYVLNNFNVNFQK